MKMIKKFLLGILVVSGFFLPHGCNCSGKGNDTTGSTADSTTDSTTQTAVKTVSFQTSGVPVDNSVYIEAISSDADKITLAVKVKGGTDVYGAALKVTYDKDKISFDNNYSAEGNYLGIDAKECSAKLYQGKQGTLVIGISKTGDVRGVDGGGFLVAIDFKALAAQSNTLIEFDTANSALYNSLNPLNPPGSVISGTGWFGGSLSYE